MHFKVVNFTLDTLYNTRVTISKPMTIPLVWWEKRKQKAKKENYSTTVGLSEDGVELILYLDVCQRELAEERLIGHDPV